MEDKVILFIGYNKWRDYRGDSTEWALRLAKKHKVVFVEGFSRYELMKTQGGLLRYLKSLFSTTTKKISKNLIVVSSPPMLPLTIRGVSRFYRREWASLSIKASKAIQAKRINKILDKLGLSPSVLMFYEPLDFLLIGKFREMISCFVVYDEVSYFWLNRDIADVIGEIEKQYIGNVDLIFASSKAQYEKRKELNSGTFFIPHGVDFDLYNKALSQDLRMPDDLVGIPGPIIGLFGHIDYRLDEKLLELIATSHPEWAIVLIGPVDGAGHGKVAYLSDLPNVHMLGKKPHYDLPRYLKYFDVALNPNLVIPSSNTMFPGRIHEYLSAGKPVISTNQAELQGFHEVVRIARSYKEFIAMIEDELRTDSDQKRGHRIEVARQNSMDKRIAQISALMLERLRKKSLSEERHS